MLYKHINDRLHYNCCYWVKKGADTKVFSWEHCG